TIVLRVIDNGCGFDVEDVMGKDMEEFNMGITTIKELVDIMKGDLQIVSKSPKGTSLTIAVPC
ncbi:MAG: ATP-binding protein, partial [Candidatus Brocadiales bacterium]|nr:ATP-binding protein [Candidatus Brocadiales bacterium]